MAYILIKIRKIRPKTVFTCSDCGRPGINTYKNPEGYKCLLCVLGNKDRYVEVTSYEEAE